MIIEHFHTARACRWNKSGKLSATHTMNFNTTFFSVIGQNCRQGCVQHTFYWVELQDSLCMCVCVCVCVCVYETMQQQQHLQRASTPGERQTSCQAAVILLSISLLLFSFLPSSPPIPPSLQSTPYTSGLFFSAEM